MNKTKYFLLYLKTGGGHLAPAKAISDYINKNYPEKAEVQLIDGFAEAEKITKYVIEDGYRKLQKNAKWFYEFLYALYHLPFITNINDIVLANSIRPYLERKILEEKPDKIIIFHFFLITHVYHIIKKYSLNIKVLTVVTDPYTAHPFWFKRKNQEYIIFSSSLKQALIKQRIPENKLHLFPFILNEKFDHPVNDSDKLMLKQKHGFSDNKKIVMVFGGGDGIPKGKGILKELLSANIDANIGIVCGRNKSLYKQAEQIKTETKAENLKIFGYVDFIFELLNISDIVITKAGASAAMEILSLKKIPIIIDYLWGQELGNVEFIVKNNMGIFERNVGKLPQIVNKLLNDVNYYNQFCNNIEKLRIKNGTPSVSEFIITF